MKILFLIHRLPCPPDRGSKLRAWAALRYLAQRHDVWCAGFLDTPGFTSPPPAVRKALSDLRRMCRDVFAVPLRRTVAEWRALRGLLTRGTCTENYFASPRLERRVMAWAEIVGFDAVFAFSSSMGPLALKAPASRHVLCFDDLDSQKWMERAPQARWPMNRVYRTEGERLAKREREWIAAFDASIFVNQREVGLIQDERLRRRMHVIEAALDLPVAETAPPLPREPVVGFLGAMDYAPNVEAAEWFADAIWPRIRTHRPDSAWWIVGRSPTRAVRRLADGTQVRVTGTVPAVEPYLNAMRVKVAPLRLARGVQIKVLVAMAAARPCVVTPCVAEGIGASARRDLIVADSPASFAEAVVELLNDDRRAEAIGQAGRAFVMDRIQSGDTMARLEKLLLPEPDARPGPGAEGSEFGVQGSGRETCATAGPSVNASHRP